MRMEYQDITKEELEKMLNQLYENYSQLLNSFKFDGKYECICGTISDKIVNFFDKKLGFQAHYMDGTYHGRGTEFSGGKSGTGHCWVELWLRVRNSILDECKEIKVIIDGAYAQFFPFELTPRITRDRQRLMIFIDDKTAEDS